MTNVTEQKATGPLRGLKVIDLSHIMAGPACAMLLADMGADVIKVEKIPGGDDARRMVPPTIAAESAAFLDHESKQARHCIEPGDGGRTRWLISSAEGR
jgi:crotonobetainyl-CoA:carnitine CoA-transferase CaiB-like acyl-CoA transferase